ncbi:hypothetical protein F4813DRAFT_371585 [Daldinia decipiens]|uniref:uncharacterized protein n=1 Tax=Daldinia decipiens TaxID=326647 RepID=UPI0020C5AFD7|nr:uncharacterized protein F4813DRAFT_371585 [Daldinia decipiens]KAI1654375.1 hypothetical protein F4813DRAFT_371585 [Daldinia decipiens]
MSVAIPGADQPDENRGPHIAGVVVSTTLAALIVVCARMYVRLRMIRAFGTDDSVMLVAMLISLVGMGIIIAEVHYGAGRHAAYLDPKVNRFGLKLNFATQPIYLWAISTVKVSVGFFLFRISPNVYYKRILQGVMTFLMTYTFVCFMTLMLQCKNLAVIWDSRIQTTCWPQLTIQALSYANATISIITDLFFALLPIPMLWNVKINARTKASLMCIFGLGIFACAAAIVKAVFISNYGKTGDFLWDSANLTIWIVVETNTGIIAASLPCIKPMFKTMLHSSLRYGSYRKKDAYNLHGYAHGTGPKESNHSHSQTRTEVDAQRVAIPKSLATNICEESILTQKTNEITKPTAVTIDRSGEESGEISGWHEDYPERAVEDRL